MQLGALQRRIAESGGGDSGRTQLALGRMEKEGFVFYTLVAHADGQVYFIHSTRSSFIRPNLAYWPSSLRDCYYNKGHFTHEPRSVTT